jgi:polysaccharide chain length determinant protein (PEP-CTERM system associated)
MNLQQIIDEIFDHMRGMWRFRWVTLAVSWVIALVAWYVVYTMPNIYEAAAKVSVDTNRLLPVLTRGLTAEENLLDEVGLVSKALLTRPNLETVARETDLDLRAETPQQFEVLISSLQKKVNVTGGRENIFTIRYADADRIMARDVVSALLDTFVESSLGAQGDDADMTERAISMELEDHEQRLEQAEKDLAEFKKQNLGYMPDEGADYYTRLQQAISSVSETERQLRLMRQRRDVIARQIEGEEPVFGLMPSTPAQVAANCSQSANIAQLRADLSALLVNFTEKHPRVVILRETIASLEEQCQAEVDSLPPMPAVDAAGQSLNENPVYQSLRLQLSEAEVELASLQEQYRTAQQAVAQLRADVDNIGEVETNLKRLNRDYGVVADRYQQLLQRWEALQSKKRIDPVTDQVQFNILEPPFAATRPVGPNRPLLLTGSLMFAIAAGIGVAFGLNQLKPVFFTRHSVRRVTGLPVLGTVSLIISPDVMQARRRTTMVWAGANLGLIGLSVLLIAFQEPLSAIVREMLGGAGV